MTINENEMPPGESFDSEASSNNVDPPLLNEFITEYDRLSTQILECVKNNRPQDIEQLWIGFWSQNEVIPLDTIQEMCEIQPIREHMLEIDINLYQTILDCFIPNFFLCPYNREASNAMQLFGLAAEDQLIGAMRRANIQEEFIDKKAKLLKGLAPSIRKYISLNHVAKTAWESLKNRELCQNMAADWERLDIQSIHKENLWITKCQWGFIRSVIVSFSANLRRGGSSDNWISWIKAIINVVFHDVDSRSAEFTGKRLLLNWNFYTSLITRTMAIKRLDTYGPFTILRVLFDDFMTFFVEMKIAEISKLPYIGFYTLIEVSPEEPP